MLYDAQGNQVKADATNGRLQKNQDGAYLIET